MGFYDASLVHRLTAKLPSGDRVAVTDWGRYDKATDKLDEQIANDQANDVPFDPDRYKVETKRKSATA